MTHPFFQDAGPLVREFILAHPVFTILGWLLAIAAIYVGAALCLALAEKGR